MWYPGNTHCVNTYFIGFNILIKFYTFRLENRESTASHYRYLVRHDGTIVLTRAEIESYGVRKREYHY